MNEEGGAEQFHAATYNFGDRYRYEEMIFLLFQGGE
jgi:hypothetical protein